MKSIFSQPRGTTEKFQSNLAESYSKIAPDGPAGNEKVKNINELSGDQILAVLDLPNLEANDQTNAAPRPSKEHYFRKIPQFF